MTKTLKLAQPKRERERERVNSPNFFNKNSFRFIAFFLILSGSFLFVGIGQASAAGCAGTGSCYWVGGSGNWSDTSHWATASGGGTTGSVPTLSDNVIFDSLSHTTNYTVTVDATAYSKDMTWANPASGKPTLSGTAAIHIYGSLVFVSGMTTTGYTGTLAFNATSGTNTITLNNATLVCSVQFNGEGGTFQLSGNLYMTGSTSLYRYAGTFDANGKTVTMAGTNNIIGSEFTGVNSFYNLTRTGAASTAGYLSLGGNINVTNTLTITGNSSINRILVTSNTIGTKRYIWANSLVVTNADFKDIGAVPYGVSRNVVSIGDSLTGPHVGQLNYRIQQYSGIEWTDISAGIGGNTTTQMLARFTTDVLNVSGVEYVVILGGINDILGNATAATIESNLQAMYDAAHTAGLKVTAVTLTPFKTSANWSSARQEVLDEVNTWIIAHPTNVDYVINAYSVLEDPTAPDTTLPAYAAADYLHLSVAGYTLLADTIYAGTTWVVASDAWDLSAITGGSGDAGGNNRITFTPTANQYWKHGATASDNWSTVGNWYLATNGGGGAGRIPLPQDTAIFDANSFSASGKTVTIDMPRIPTTTFAAVTNGPTLTTSTAASMFGSLTLAPVANWTFTASTQAYTFEGRSSYTLTTNGNTWAKNLTLNAPIGTLTLADTPTMGTGNTFTITNGTLGASYKVMTIAPTTAFTQGGGTINFYNNTFYRASAGSTLISKTTGTLNLKNNTFYNISDVLSSSGGTNTISNNDYYNSSNEAGTGSVISDPLFANAGTDFNLLSTSTNIEAGTDVSLITDYASNPIYGTPDIGAYEYQPPYTFADNNIPTTGSTRLYSDGKYRALTATTSTATGTFSVTPVGGFYTASTSQYMDITIDSWLTSGTKNKQWTATSSIAAFNTHATSTIYTIGDLLPNTSYQFTLDSVVAPTTITDNSQCSSGVCKADANGQVQFTYTGGYSTHTFALTKMASASAQHGTITVTAVVINDNGGTKTSSDFPLFVNGTQVTSGTATSFPAPANAYTISETTNPNYTQSFSGDCDSTGHITLSPGDYKTCTVTNDDIASAVVSSGSSSTPVVATTTAVTTTSSQPETPANTSGLSQTQIQSILALLSAFGADADTIANVQAALGGTLPVQHQVLHISRDLKLNSTGNDVKQLQQFLNTHGFTVATTGPGSEGNETEKFGILTQSALIKFQKANNITPAVGYFGPLTRAVVEADG